jgi:poly(A) polymerase
MFAVNPALSGLLNRTSSILIQENCQAYVVGGFVRDRLLNRETEDIDIAVNGDALIMAQKIAGAIDGRYVLLDETNKVTRVVVIVDEKPYYLDFISFVGIIEDDLARRDFTIDAMAVELRGLLSGLFQVIDPFAGGSDLKTKLVRAVSPLIFQNDAARLLRAARLAAELGFKIEPTTERLLQQNCQLAQHVPGERVREELLRLLAVRGAADWMRYLDWLGLLLVIIPELGVMKDVEQPKEHCWNVFDHSLETVAAVELMLRENNWKHVTSDILSVTLWSDEIKQYFDEEVSTGSNRRQLLRLAGLLHDIAKPSTKTVEETGKVRFLGHGKDGATIAKEILQRLRFSSKEINLVENLVYHHLRPAQMSNEGLPSSRAIYRYFRDTEGAGLDILFLALADYLATHGPRLDVVEWQQHNQLISYVYHEHLKQQEKTLPVKLIDGHDIIDALGLSPGPVIGKLLTEVHEAQAAGEVNSRDEAISLVIKLMENRHCGVVC